MTYQLARALYLRMPVRLAEAREAFGRPLTYAEKILVAHADDFPTQDWKRGKAMLALRPDRVAMQDATAQMAMLQFMQSGRPQAAVPSSIHCDHLILAKDGVEKDLPKGLEENKEVFAFLSSAARKYGIGFWKPGSGIIHQVVLENYAFPGGLMIGTDSHTPNSGGLGLMGVGVGGADAGEVMAGLAWEVLHPRLIGVHLKGRLQGWASPKDVILHLCGLLTVKGGTNKIVEYFGEGTESLSCTGKATICNMGAELGATSSVFPFDARMAAYLRRTDRADLADLAEAHGELLRADPEVLADPATYFDEVVEIDLSTLEPQVVGPHTPDLTRGVSLMGADAFEKGYPLELRACLIGSCTNSSYEDLSRAASLARQALEAGLSPKVPLFISPGSERVFETIQRDGLLDTFRAMGATVLTNACGPCIGQWHRTDAVAGRAESIISTFNRNFPGRNDGVMETHSFLAGPELVMAYAFSGRLDWNPLTDALEGPEGRTFRFAPPEGLELPEGGFMGGASGYVAPAEDGTGLSVEVDPASERIALLQPFQPWDGQDFRRLPLLVKTKGKTTTDHISPAGKWLRFRGHLDRISDNMFLGALNAFTGEAGKGVDITTGEGGLTFSQIARRYKAQGLGSVVVGDENYGEGSSREHAAMCPRYLGVRAVIARSFARIHETNLKKQGLLPLTFANPADWALVDQDDHISILDLNQLAPGVPVKVVLHKADGSEVTLQTVHTLTRHQLSWFKAGSALNAESGSHASFSAPPKSKEAPMTRTAKLELEGKVYEYPIIEGTEGEKAIDISHLRAQTGYITLDDSYGNTGSCQSHITFIDGDRGILRYRGIPIEEMALGSTFIQAAYLIIFGKLPTEAERAQFSGLLTKYQMIHEDMKFHFEGFPSTAHPMAILSAMINAAGCFIPELTSAYDPLHFEQQSARLLSQVRTLAAYAYRKSRGLPFIHPKKKYMYTENFLHMMFSDPDEDYELNPSVVDALDLIFLLHADHEQNCSTSTVRMVASSQANLFASAAAGVCALWGARHGGANQAVIEMLEDIRATGDDGSRFIHRVKNKDSKAKLMGFGHRVYKNYDPRARIIKQRCDEVLGKLGVSNPLLDIAKHLEDVALSDPYFIERKLYPNVDFYSGIILNAIGIPLEMFTVIFAIGRMPGWIANYKEVMEDPTGRIYRPRQVYQGPTLNHYIPIHER